jgi:hypothetical protein
MEPVELSKYLDRMGIKDDDLRVAILYGYALCESEYRNGNKESLDGVDRLRACGSTDFTGAKL